MSTLSTLIDKFLTRSTMTDTDKEDIRGDIGAVGTALEITTALQGAAAVATKIGAEYMPSVIEGSFELADTTGTVIPLNQIGGVFGVPAVGDGTTLEGKLISPRRTRFRVVVPSADLVTGKIVAIGSTPISSERISNLQNFALDFDASFSRNGYSGAIELYVGLSGYTGYVLPTVLGTSAAPRMLKLTLENATYNLIRARVEGVPVYSGLMGGPPFTAARYTVKPAVLTTGSAGTLESIEYPYNLPPVVKLFALSTGTANPVAGMDATSGAENASITVFAKIPADAAATQNLYIDGIINALF